MEEANLIDKSVIETGEMVLNMGPQHPSTHGVLRLKIHTDGEIVSRIEPSLVTFIVVLRNIVKSFPMSR